jgi:DNA-binding response OmpR family regulator
VYYLMPQKILVVDDDVKIVNLVKLYLEQERYQVFTAYDGLQALEMARQKQPDLIILDLMLPKVDGLDVLRLLTQEGGPPIIMLTARRTEDDKLVGLELGADDYVTKPFSPRELVARVRVVLRRFHKGQVAPPEQVVLGDLVVDYGRREAIREGVALPLTPAEFNLLAFMAQNHGRVYSRQTLLDELFGYDAASLERTIDTHIMNLRRKIEPDPAHPIYVHTVYGQGYRVEYKATNHNP